MLKPGSSEASVKATAAILQAELDRRGIDVEVNPRFAKDPANPPYVTLSLITKEGAARYIAQARKAGPQDVVILGDSMYVPHAPKAETWLTRLGERASGQARPALGNRTDANMERGVAGALTLSVGTTGDPRTKNLYVLAGKGPSVTRRVLEAVAARPASFDDGSGSTRDAAVAALFLAVVVSAYAFGIQAFTDFVSHMEGLIQHGGDAQSIEGAALFGGILGLNRAAKSAKGAPSAAPRRRWSQETRDALIGGVLFVAIVTGIIAFASVAANLITDGIISVERSLRDAPSDPLDPGPPPNY